MTETRSRDYQQTASLSPRDVNILFFKRFLQLHKILRTKYINFLVIYLSTNFLKLFLLTRSLLLNVQETSVIGQKSLRNKRADLNILYYVFT